MQTDRPRFLARSSPSSRRELSTQRLPREEERTSRSARLFRARRHAPRLLNVSWLTDCSRCLLFLKQPNITDADHVGKQQQDERHRGRVPEIKKAKRRAVDVKAYGFG